MKKGHFIWLVVNVENTDFNIWVTPNNTHSLDLKKGKNACVLFKPASVKIIS